MPRPVRLLPLAMGAMALLALVKLGGVAMLLLPGPAGARSGLVAPALAAEPPAAKPPPPPAAPAPAPASPPPPPSSPAVPEASEAEKGLLRDLRARREALEARSAALDRRETVMAAAERGLQERLDQLNTMQGRLEAMEKTRSEREEANWRGLVKTYEAMRPRDAAAIFNDLEPGILVEVLDRMKEAKAAPVLAAMQPDRARAATSQLAQWRQRVTGGPNG